MLIYVDNDYKCHVADDGRMRGFEVPEFSGKCSAFIEGYRYVPPGEIRMGEDGTEYQGEQISPWKDYTELYIAQLEYEKTDMKAALEVLEVEAE